MPKPKRITSVLTVTCALIAGSLVLGASAATASPPSTAAQTVTVSSGGGLTVVFECHAAHILQIPLAASTTVSCYTRSSNGEIHSAPTVTRPGGYAGTGALARLQLLPYVVCVTGSVTHFNGTSQSSGETCYQPTL